MRAGASDDHRHRWQDRVGPGWLSWWAGSPGHSGDIIAVNGDPLEDVTVVENIDWVMVHRKFLK